MVRPDKDLQVFGTIVDMKVMRDVDPGRSRCYGFVTFAQVSPSLAAASFVITFKKLLHNKTRHYES